MSGDDQAPARVLLSNFGSFGDVIPFLQMGKALHERGHEVTFATTANLRPQVEAAGLIFRSIGTAKRMDALHAEPGLWDPKRGLELMYDLAVELTEPSRQIVERERAQSAAEGRSFVAVGGMLSFGLRLARDCHPFPLMTVYLSPFLMRSRHRPPVLPGIDLPSWLPGPVTHGIQRLVERWIVDPKRLPALNAIRLRHGLPRIDNLSDWLPSPDRLCLLAPPWFASPQSDWPSQTAQTAFPRSSAEDLTGAMSEPLRAFLKAGEKPVVVTYGSTMQHGGDFFRAASEACARVGQRAVLVTGAVGQGCVPPRLDQIVVPHAPFGELLPHARALIHHGGIGTCFEAFDAGIPQIVVPNAFDQMDNAHRVAQLGLGLRVDRKDFAKIGQEALTRLLADAAIARNCAEARRRCVNQDGIVQACDLVEEMSVAPRIPSPVMA